MLYFIRLEKVVKVKIDYKFYQSKRNDKTRKVDGLKYMHTLAKMLCVHTELLNQYKQYEIYNIMCLQQNSS